MQSIGCIKEFHYITPLENLTSILEMGILSHNLAEGVKAGDVSMSSVQRLRAHKLIPGELTGGVSKTVHDFANVYFNAQNPMLFKLKDTSSNLCVLRIRKEALDLPDAIVADRNAATDEVQFFKAAEGTHRLALNVLFGPFWTSKFETPEENKRRGQLRCAELLVPGRIHPSYIGGLYVGSLETKKKVESLFSSTCPVSISIQPTFFFDRRPNLQSSLLSLSNTQYPSLTTCSNHTTKRAREDSDSRVGSLKIRKVEAMKTGPGGAVTAQVPLSPQKKVVNTYSSPVKGLHKYFPRKVAGEAEQIAPYTLTMPATIVIREGSLFDSKMQTLVNTVNCKGAMGKGIALQFKKKYPQMFKEYQNLCKQNKVKPGQPYVHTLPNGKKIVNFPTKDDWRHDSKLPWIEKGLDVLVENIEKWNITSIALPPLGCGNGNLDWHIVRALMVKKLEGLSIKVEIYNPQV